MMYSALRTGLIVSATALFAFTTTLSAQDQSGTNADTSEESGFVAQLSMAQDLYEYGAENRDALSVLTAARIMASINVDEVDREKETQDGEEEIAEEGEGTDAPVLAEEMLALAEELAGDDEALKGLIADAKAEGSRGRYRGPSRTLSRLRPGKVDVWTITFTGGRFAEIGILGDGDANLDAVVADQNGNTICIDRSYSDRLYCSFTPRWTGPFYVTVVNRGRIRNSYYLVTN